MNPEIQNILLLLDLLDRRIRFLETHVDIIRRDGDSEADDFVKARNKAISSGMPMGPTDTNHTLLNG